ncbi:OmpA family protein [Marinilabilia sp.]
MQLKPLHLLLFTLLSLPLNGQIFGPKRANIEMNVSDWKIMLGDTVTLSWDITLNRKHLIVTLNDSVVERKGSIRLCPDTTSFYRINAETAKGKRVGRTKKIKVLEPRIERLSMSDSIRFNHQDKVKWRAENVETVTLNGMPVPKQGDTIITIPGDLPMTLAAVNKNGNSVTQTDTIRAWYRYNFSVTGFPDRDTLIVKGGSKVNLKWTLDDVAETTLNEKSVSGRGELPAVITTDTTFTLEAKHRDGSVYQKSVSFIKKPVNLQHFSITNLFTKTASVGQYTEPVRKFNPYKIRWNVTGVDKVWVDGISRPAAGTLPDQAMQETEHTITWAYYDDNGKIRKDSSKALLKLMKRPLFSGNVRTQTLMSEDTVYMEIISVNYDNYPPETVLKVIAVDDRGNFISGLANRELKEQKTLFHSILEKYEHKTHPVSDFTVKEHGISEKEYRPQSIMMVTDYSGSMLGAIQELEPLIRQQIKNKHPLDTIRFLKFDETITAISPASTEVDSLLKYFDETGMETLSGSTALYAATDSAMNGLTANNPNQRIILFTDGYENASYIYNNRLNTSAVDIIRRANKMDLPVYVVSLGGFVNEYVMRYLADYTNAHYYQVNDVKSVSEAIREIFKSNLHYYTISYKTKNKYQREKTITLTYDNNVTGLNYSSKKAAKKPNLLKIQRNDIPPLPQTIQTFLNKQNLTPLTGPQNVVNFRFDKHRVREEYTHDIQQYLEVLKDSPDTKAIIMGHTDMKGHPDYCMQLSKKRATAVARKFMAAGISPDRLFTMGFGKSHPLWLNDSAPARAAENRRVEILFVE